MEGRPFPAWVRSGPERAGRVGGPGQNMLLIIVYAATLAVLIAVPAACAVGLHVLLRPAIGGWADALGAGVAIPLMAFEARVIVKRLGVTVERTDPVSMEA